MSKFRTKPLSKLFYNKGLTLSSGKKKLNLAQLSKKEIIPFFHKYGIILFDNFETNSDSFFKFTKRFTNLFSNDATRRETKFGNRYLKSVDIGNHVIEMHSEASFTISCPEIIWFYCQKPIRKNQGGLTKICDGIELWNQLSLKTKKFFLKNPITFNNRIYLNEKKNKKAQNWMFNFPGAHDVKINWKKGIIEYKLTKFLMNETKFPNLLAFANHLLSVEQEDQIIDCFYKEKYKIPKKIFKEIRNLTNKISLNFEWKKNQILMIDNKRFIHGRTEIKPGSKRDIINVQTLKSNF